MPIPRGRFGAALGGCLSAFLLAGTTAAVGARQSAPGRSGDPAIPWSAERSLAWSQYAGRPDLGTTAAAMTVYKLSYQEECAGEAFEFQVVPLFLPSRSWVKASVLSNFSGGGRLLAHEQGHFDLSEVQARKLRRALGRLEHPCAMTWDARRALVRQHVRDDLEAQYRYDRDTGYGSNETRQVRWLLDIGRQLAALTDFADGGPR